MRDNGLSVREHEIVDLVRKGARNKEIAEALMISSNTVKTHIGRIMAKLNAVNRTQLAFYATDNTTPQVEWRNSVRVIRRCLEEMEPRGPLSIIAYKQALKTAKELTVALCRAIGHTPNRGGTRCYDCGESLV